MNMPIHFNTLDYARKLSEAGLPAEQAEAHAQALADALSEATVTPSELVLLRTDLLARIEMLRTETLASLDKFRVETQASLDKFRVETQASIEKLRAETQAGIEKLRAETQASIEQLRNEMNSRLGRVEAHLKRLYWLVGLTLLSNTAVLITVLLRT
ncbi:MAG: DUF1640 domain-containing protein [Burkholderiaceae bacterium]|nr:DUF1640 domain-containing protein [Burkholderiaceae bacterium]